MKKLLILLILIAIPTKIFASEWVEVANKIYVSIDKNRDGYIFYWVKYLNDGNMSPIKKQKVNHELAYYAENCAQNSSAIMAGYYYAINGSVLDSYVSPFYNHTNLASFEPVIPQTNGEAIHKYVCGMN